MQYCVLGKNQMPVVICFFYAPSWKITGFHDKMISFIIMKKFLKKWKIESM